MAVSVLVHLMLAGGVACVLLGGFVVAADLIVWRGLDFPLDVRRGLGLLAAGAALVGGGILAFRWARRFI